MENQAQSHFLETRDRSLLLRYFELRNRVFRLSNSYLPEDFGKEDPTDSVSFFALAVRDGVVAGGARLTISSASRPVLLPLEQQLFTVEDPDGHPYAEISRMAVDMHPSERAVLSLGISRKLCEIAGREGVNIIYSICPENSARLNRINARKCGVEFRLHRQRRATGYGLEMSLCSFRGVLRAYGSHQEAA